MSLKNVNDTVGNRTRDLTTCKAFPQPNAPPRALINQAVMNLNVKNWLTGFEMLGSIFVFGSVPRN
jgi:hypothetical protein